MSPCQLILWAMFLWCPWPLWLLLSFLPLLHRTPHALPNVWLWDSTSVPISWCWSRSGLFDEGSARLWSQNTLQVVQTVGQRFRGWGYVSDPPLEVLAVTEDGQFRLCVSHGQEALIVLLYSLRFHGVFHCANFPRCFSDAAQFQSFLPVFSASQ